MVSKEVNIKMSDEKSNWQASPPSTENQFNLEGILSELGSFGKYHIVLLFLLSFRDTFLGMCNYHYVFTAAEVKFRCFVPECESLDSSFYAPWTEFAIANNTDTCYRMLPLNVSTFNFSSENQQENSKFIPNEMCSKLKFDARRKNRCDKVVYEDQNSIVAEFDLGCEPWKRTLIGTIHGLGLVFSNVISGFISDRFGRKVIIVGTPLVVGILGLVKSFSVNYWMLIVLEFLETALGYGNASIVLSLETVSQSKRVIFSCISDILSNFGGAFFGLIAWKVPYWRYMMRAIYAPLLVAVFYIFLVDEGVRWLWAHNKKEEAVRVLNKVAKFNNITLSDKAKEMLNEITEEKNKAEQIKKENKKSTVQLISVLRSKTIIFRVILMALFFNCCLFLLNGGVIYSANISGNKYLNYSIIQLVSIPTRIITALTLTRFGRKAPICTAYCLCAMFFIGSAFVPDSLWWISVLLYLLGKMSSSYGIFSVFVVTLEIFPTTSRNSLTNISNTIGRMGSVLAPQTPLLDKYMKGLPSIVFGVVALGPALLAFLLPDTSKAALPDNLVQAEKLDEPKVIEKDDTNESIKEVERV